MSAIICHVACVAGPQFYGGPDLQRVGFANQAPHKTEGLPRRLYVTWSDFISDKACGII